MGNLPVRPNMLPRLRRWIRGVKARLVSRYLFATDERVVAAGPFKGLVYPTDVAVGSELIPKLVGSYELEIQDWVRLACRKSFHRIVNVGSGEGYYAVGFARCMPSAEVYAFDPDRTAQLNCGMLSRANDVSDRVFVRGECRADQLETLLIEGTLLVCDCEGCEYDLLDIERIPSLRFCDILVELHARDEGVTSTENLLRQFERTHDVDVRTYGARRERDFPALEAVPRPLRAFALDENRSRGLTWAFLRSKCRTS